MVGALLWAKWGPYAGRVAEVGASHSWGKGDMLSRAGAAGSAPSLSGALDFTVAYFTDVWKGFAAALLIGAAVDALLPREWLLRITSAGSRLRGSLTGGIAGVPSMMCTCCAAPVAVSMRRDGVRPSATLAYLLACPLLNPAVIVFLAILAPWQWAALRVGVGLVLVFGLTALLVYVMSPRVPEPQPAAVAAPESRPEPAGFVGRFARRLAWLTLTLTPIYVAVIFLLGLFRGWVFPLDGTTAGLLAVGRAAVLGTLVDLPTAGEVPLLLGLAAGGLGAGATGALLITLPAFSLVTMAMIVRTHGVGLTLGTAGAVVASGVLAAGSSSSSPEALGGRLRAAVPHRPRSAPSAGCGRSPRGGPRGR